MKLLTILIAITILLFSVGCAKKPIYKSEWQSHPLKAGEFADYWHAPLQYNSKAQMLYGISNDNQNLYVALQITDKTVQRKILLTGLTFWLDTTAKGKEQLGLTFPVQKSSQINRGKNKGQQQSNQRMSKTEIRKFNEKYANGMSEILIVGYDGETESRLGGNKSTKGINAILSLDSLQVLYYEVQIPLQMIFHRTDTFLSDSTKYFSYAFETGHFEMPLQASGGMKGKGGGQGGGGGRGGGGGGSGQSSGGNSEMKQEMLQMSQPSKFQVKKASLSNTFN